MKRSTFPFFGKVLAEALWKWKWGENMKERVTSHPDRKGAIKHVHWHVSFNPTCLNI